MRVSLPPKLESFVRAKVKSGRYQDVSDVVREALRQMQAAEKADKARLQTLRDAVAVGAEQAERGEFADYSIDRLISDLDAELAVDRAAS